jgi:hypothetical protein
MSALSEVKEAPKAVINFARYKPAAFALCALLLIIAVVRFRAQVTKFFTGLPVVGKFFAKAFGGVAALVLVLTSTASDALAAVASNAPTLGAGSVTDWLGYIAGLTGVAALGSTFFPMEYPMDLKTDGGDTNVAITPGTAETQKTFKITSPKGEVNGGWIKPTAIHIDLLVGLDQTGSGSTINADELPRVIAGLEIQSPLFGTILTKETGFGPYLKHILEFVSGGYQYDEGCRAQIAAADGDTAVRLYTTYHFAQRGFCRPHDFAPWIGWLDQTLITYHAGVTTALDAVSTGVVLEATSNLSMQLSYIVDNHLEVPVLAHWKKYTHNAGSNTIKMLDVGGEAGLNGVQKYTRLAGLYECFDQLGMGGPDGADNITQIVCEQLGISRTVNIGAMVRNYLRLIGNNRGPKGGVGASTPLHDGAGNPYTMAAAPNGALNASTLAYMAITSPGRMAEITKIVKIAADLELTQTYTTTPSSGSHVMIALGIREFTPAKKKELQARANRLGRPVSVPLADGNKETDVIKPSNARQFLTLPRRID